MTSVVAILLLGMADWAEILRDAQVTNRANLRQGVAVVELVYTPPKSLNDRDVTVQAEVQWSDDLLFEKYRFQSFGDFPYGRTEAGAIENATWNYYLKNSSEFVGTNIRTRVVDIRRASQDPEHPTLNFHPWDVWLSCCPPSKKVRPWSGMIDYLAATPDGRKSTREFIELDPGHIKQVRRDPDGFVVETTFSLSEGGNVVRFESIPTPATKQRSIGHYRWRKLGPAFVLDSCEFRVEGRGPRTDEVEVYRLSVKSVDLRPVAPEVFTRPHLMGLLPPGEIQLMDYAGNKFGKIPGKPGVDDEELRSLADKLRSRGYAKPD